MQYFYCRGFYSIEREIQKKPTSFISKKSSFVQSDDVGMHNSRSTLKSVLSIKSYKDEGGAPATLAIVQQND